ncbi:hypothetical protein [Nibricoccus sp. IMCC34717]|uniref:hypothetical protein n=1 Tax=Nibricoccus sp. IMCC34717 TaxID=3034021 RepID=UPI00384AA281
MSKRRQWTAISAVVALAACAFLLLQCRQKSGPAGVATVVFANEAGSGWRISIVNTNGGAARVVRVPPLGETQVELEPGRQVVSQVLLDIHGRTLDRREATVTLDRGVSYRWRLLTLQSPAPKGVVP